MAPQLKTNSCKAGRLVLLVPEPAKSWHVLFDGVLQTVKKGGAEQNLNKLVAVKYVGNNIFSSAELRARERQQCHLLPDLQLSPSEGRCDYAKHLSP